MTEWIVVATRTIENRKGRRRERDFHTDQSGFSFAKASSNMAPHRLNPNVSHVEAISQKFAHKIVEVIKKSHEQNLFDKLTLVAPPHFLGLLRAQSGDDLKKIGARAIHRSLGDATTSEILDHLPK